MLLVVAVVAIGVPAAVAGATTSTSVPITSCGQVITADAVLRTDLVCSGDALTIEASNITVKLAGHSITSSDGTGVGVRFGLPNSQACVSNVAVRGGRISGFFGGVGGVCFSATGDSVSAMTLTGNTWGAGSGQPTSPSAVDHTTIVGPNGVGLKCLCPGSSTGTVHMTHSTIEVTSATGVAWFSAHDPANSIDSSRIEGGLLEPGANGNLTISRSRLTGVTVWCSDANITVSNSDLIASPVIAPFACDTDLQRRPFRRTGHGRGTCPGLLLPGLSVIGHAQPFHRLGHRGAPGRGPRGIDHGQHLP